MIFSSLLFIGVGDTEIIVIRYCVSALAVLVIRHIEATGLLVAFSKATAFLKVPSYQLALAR